MNSKDIDKYLDLSHLTSNNKNMYVQSSKMDFELNRYVNEIHSYEQNSWRQILSEKNINYSTPLISPDGEYFLYTKTSFLDKKEEEEADTEVELILREIETEKLTSLMKIDKSDTKSGKSIVKYIWSSDSRFVYVSIKEPTGESAEEPLYITSLPFRFDNKGLIFNKRNSIDKINILTNDAERLVDGFQDHILSINSYLIKDNSLIYITDSYNKEGNDLVERIVKTEMGSGEKEIIHEGGNWWELVCLEDNLYAVGLSSRMDWPKTPSLYSVTTNGDTEDLLKELDRDVVDVKKIDKEIYITYEDSGKVCLGIFKDSKIETLSDNKETITSISGDSSGIYAIINNQTCPGEVYKLSDTHKRISEFNKAFKDKVSLIDYEYRRINTGDSEIDTWGLLVDPDAPTLLNVHGGPAAQYGFTFFDEFQVYAEAGFNVIACNPRGSSGRGDVFIKGVKGEYWGVNDVHDVVTSFDKMINEMGITNPKFGIMGGSYGGFMTSWVIGNYPEKFESAVVERALLNWTTMVSTSDIGYSFPSMYLEETIENNPELYEEKSPISYANNIIAPTLIIHSENDFRCPMEQAEQLFSILKRRNIESALLRFPGEGHELSRSGKPKHRDIRFNHIINWHKKYLFTD